MLSIIELDKNQEDYINRVLELEKESFGKSGGLDIWLLKPLLKYGKVLGLLDENKNLIGVAEFIKDFDTNLAYLYGLCICKEERAKGRAKEFFKLIKKYMEAKNIDRIELTVSPKNIAAIKLYNSIGFELVKDLKAEYGEGEDRFLMTCSLK